MFGFSSDNSSHSIDLNLSVVLCLLEHFKQIICAYCAEVEASKWDFANQCVASLQPLLHILSMHLTLVSSHNLNYRKLAESMLRPRKTHASSE